MSKERIAKFSKEDLENFTLPALRKLADGLVENAAKMRKVQLIDELSSFTSDNRAIPDISPEITEKNKDFISERYQDLDVRLRKLIEWTQGFYQEFRRLVQSKFRSDGTWDESAYIDIAGMAFRVMLWLNDQNGGAEDGGLSFLTKLRYRTHIVNLLSELVESERDAIHYTQLASCLELLKRQIKIQIADLAAKKKGLQERQIAKRKEQKENIDFQPIYNLAVDTFAKLDNLKPSDWKWVSVALTIATGRRMAEIHLSRTMFKYVDKSHVSFKGQLKAKGDAAEYFKINSSYEIPVLVDATLVIKAHQWLRDNKKLADKPESANKRYSSDLSQFMKGLRKDWGVQHSLFTYKGLRAIYASVCNQKFNGADPDCELYLAKILGHGRGELFTHGKIVDVVTPQSYKSDFRVIGVDCVQI